MLIVASIFAVGVVVAAFICRNGFYFTFRLTAGGIWSHMGEREEGIANSITVGGILAGSHGAKGGGLLTKAEQNVFTPWLNIKKVKGVEKYCLIKIGRSFGYNKL